MKILLLNSVYREGSTGKIVGSLADSLRDQGHEVLTCYGLGRVSIDEYSKKICTRCEHIVNAKFVRFSGIPYGGLFLSNFRIEKIIRKFKPDIVHIHCINGAIINVYSLLKFLAKNKQKTILTLHAEIFHTAGCEHAFECEKWKEACHDCQTYVHKMFPCFTDRSRVSFQRMYDAINSFSQEDLRITAVSPWLVKRVKQSFMMKQYDVEYVPNCVDSSVFHYRDSISLIPKEGYKKVLLFVTPYFSADENNIKGGAYLLKMAERMPNIKFLLVAGRMVSAPPSFPPNVQNWGRVNSQEELAQLYSEADVTLLFSKRETFSMVTAESLCCGTPVIGFKAGGPESIALENCTKFFEYGNLDEMISATSQEWEVDKKEISSNAKNKYSQETMRDSFYEIYKSLYK